MRATISIAVDDNRLRRRRATGGQLPSSSCASGPRSTSRGCSSPARTRSARAPPPSPAAWSSGVGRLGEREDAHRERRRARWRTSTETRVVDDRRREQERRRLSRHARDCDHDAGEDAADRGRQHDAVHRVRQRRHAEREARLALVRGTISSTSWVARATIGIIRIASAKAPKTALWPWPTTSRPKTKMPTTIAGTPLSTSRDDAEGRARDARPGVLGHVDRHEHRDGDRHQHRHADDQGASDQRIGDAAFLAEQRARLRKEAGVELAEPLGHHGEEHEAEDGDRDEGGERGERAQSSSPTRRLRRSPFERDRDVERIRTGTVLIRTSARARTCAR